MVKQGRWTPEEDEYIIKHYLTSDIQEIANYLNRSVGAVKSRGFKFGLKRKLMKPPWTEEDDQYLRENYPHGNIQDIMEHLGRSYLAVTGHAQIMGLKKEDNPRGASGVLKQILENQRKLKADMKYGGNIK